MSAADSRGTRRSNGEGLFSEVSPEGADLRNARIDHNFGIWPSLKDAIAEKGELFETGRFPGVATKSFRVSQVSTLPPGHYYFQCDVHGVAMAGAFIVAGPPPPGGGGGG